MNNRLMLMAAAALMPCAALAAAPSAPAAQSVKECKAVFPDAKFNLDNPQDQANVAPMALAEPCVIKAEGQPDVRLVPMAEKAGMARMVNVDAAQASSAEQSFRKAQLEYYDSQIKTAREQKARIARVMAESKALSAKAPTAVAVPAVKSAPAAKAAKLAKAPAKKRARRKTQYATVPAYDAPLYAHAPRDPVEFGAQVALAPAAIAGRVFTPAMKQIYAQPPRNPVELIGQIVFLPVAAVSSFGNAISGYPQSGPTRQVRRQDLRKVNTIPQYDRNSAIY